MTWETEFTDTTPGKYPRHVEYQTRALAHHSHAERPDRVKVSGKVVHKGYVSDHRGYAMYRAYVKGWTLCDECGERIPDAEPSLVNSQHDTSCSLYEEN
jgi:hypothetical protein